MNYRKISNAPIYRRKITHSYVWWNNAFDQEELTSIQHICESYDLEKSVTFSEEILQDYRKSKSCFIDKSESNSWIFDRFNHVINELNEDYYGFELNGYQTFQYTVYDSQNNGYYNWHMDIKLDDYSKDLNKNLDDTRKLTLIMPLSQQGEDYIGGEFELNLGDHESPTMIPVYKGQIIAFPSFLIHRVKPVLRGIRKSLVIWVEGPKFR